MLVFSSYKAFLGKCKVKGNKIVTFDGLDIKLKGKKMIKLVSTDNFVVDLETSLYGNGSVYLKALTINIGTYSIKINYDLNTQQVMAFEKVFIIYHLTNSDYIQS